MNRYFFIVVVLLLLGVFVIIKAAVIMFAERQYWQEVADRFVKENVTVRPNRGNILARQRVVVSYVFARRFHVGGKG